MLSSRRKTKLKERKFGQNYESDSKYQSDQDQFENWMNGLGGPEEFPKNGRVNVSRTTQLIFEQYDPDESDYLLEAFDETEGEICPDFIDPLALTPDNNEIETETQAQEESSTLTEFLDSMDEMFPENSVPIPTDPKPLVIATVPFTGGKDDGTLTFYSANTTRAPSPGVEVELEMEIEDTTLEPKPKDPLKPELSCKFCRKVLKSSLDRRRHELRAHGLQTKMRKRFLPLKHLAKMDSSPGTMKMTEVYRCPLCEARFMQKHTVNRHLRETHNLSREESVLYDPIKTKCCIGDAQPDDRSDRSQSPGQGEGSYFKCPICRRSIVKGNMHRHWRQVHSLPRKARSRIYQQTIKSVEDMRPEIVTDNSKSYTCPLCQKCLTHKPNLKRHFIQVHHLSLDQSFKLLKTVKPGPFKPGRGYNVPKNYPCPLCDKALAHPNNLPRHFQQVHQLSKEESVALYKRTTGNPENQTYGHAYAVIPEPELIVQETQGQGQDDAAVITVQLEENDVSNDMQWVITNIYSEQEGGDGFEQNGQDVDTNESSPEEIPVDPLSLDGHEEELQYSTVVEIDPPPMYGDGTLSTCHTCGKEFANAFALTLHLAVHTGEKLFKCTTCGQRYMTASELEIHHNTYHTNMSTTRMSTVCDICGKKFKRPNDLVQHMKFHGPDRNFECKVCGQRFKQQHHLEAHVLIHIPQRDHVCPICNKSFKFKYNLTRHVAGHSGRKNYVCDCGKRFSYAQNLQEHIRSNHTGEKPFVCSFCGESFARCGGLITHERIHQNVPPPVKRGSQPPLVAMTPAAVLKKYRASKEDPIVIEVENIADFAHIS